MKIHRAARDASVVLLALGLLPGAGAAPDACLALGKSVAEAIDGVFRSVSPQMRTAVGRFLNGPGFDFESFNRRVLDLAPASAPEDPGGGAQESGLVRLAPRFAAKVNNLAVQEDVLAVAEKLSALRAVVGPYLPDEELVRLHQASERSARRLLPANHERLKDRVRQMEAALGRPLEEALLPSPDGGAVPAGKKESSLSRFAWALFGRDAFGQIQPGAPIVYAEPLPSGEEPPGTVLVVFDPQVPPEKARQIMDSVQARSDGGVFRMSRDYWEGSTRFSVEGDAARAISALKRFPLVRRIEASRELLAASGKWDASPGALGPGEPPGTLRVVFAPQIGVEAAREILKAARAPCAQWVRGSGGNWEAFVHFAFLQDAAGAFAALKRDPGVLEVESQPKSLDSARRPSQKDDPFGTDGAAPVSATLSPDEPAGSAHVLFEPQTSPEAARAILDSVQPGNGLYKTVRECWESLLHFPSPAEASRAVDSLRRNAEIAEIEVHPGLPEPAPQQTK
jgi:hypothetical protein